LLPIFSPYSAKFFIEKQELELLRDAPNVSLLELERAKHSDYKGKIERITNGNRSFSEKVFFVFQGTELNPRPQKTPPFSPPQSSYQNIKLVGSRFVGKTTLAQVLSGRELINVNTVIPKSSGFHCYCIPHLKINLYDFAGQEEDIEHFLHFPCDGLVYVGRDFGEQENPRRPHMDILAGVGMKKLFIFNLDDLGDNRANFTLFSNDIIQRFGTARIKQVWLTSNNNAAEDGRRFTELETIFKEFVQSPY